MKSDNHETNIGINIIGNYTVDPERFVVDDGIITYTGDVPIEVSFTGDVKFEPNPLLKCNKIEYPKTVPFDSTKLSHCTDDTCSRCNGSRVNFNGCCMDCGDIRNDELLKESKTEQIIGEIIQGCKNAGCYTELTERVIRQTLRLK